MKRVYIVVEGQTEQEFVNSVISPYLQNFGILNVTPILIRTSRTGRGGMVSYSHLANTIKPLLMSEKNDYRNYLYRLFQTPSRHAPLWGQYEEIGQNRTNKIVGRGNQCGYRRPSFLLLHTVARI